MSNLQKCLLKDIAVSQTGPFGSQLHEEDYVKDGTPIVTVEHLGEVGFLLGNLPLVSDKDKARLKKFVLKEGDIVFSRVGSIDRCTYVSKKEEGWLFSGRCLRVRCNEKVDSRFVSFYFRQKYFKRMMLNISVGATMPSLNTTLMDSIPLFLPTKETQYKVALVLLALDSKIELNNRINAELEAMAKTLYDYWFVQFDFPDANGKPYKSSGGKMVWNEKLNRDIPEGWKNETLAYISKLIRGVSYDTNDIRKASDIGVIPILRATNISGNVIDLENMVYVPAKNVNSKQLLKEFDILITMSSGSKEHIGKNGFFYFDKKVAFGAFCAKLVAKGEFKFYLYSYTQSNFMFTTIKNECLGTNINNLNGKLMSGFKVIIPPADLLEKFNRKVSSVYKKIGNNLKENQQLSSLRDWLLPMLMNGQVKVGESSEQILNMAAEPETGYTRQ